MLENAQLRRYLLRSFLLTLVGIGLVQLVVNGIISIVLNPMIERSLSLSHVLSSTDIRSTNVLILQILLIFLAQRIALFMPLSSGSLVTKFLGAIFQASLVDDVAELAQKLNGFQVSGYILNVVFLLLVTVIIWLLPYVLGAIFFARVVTRKVRELEEHRIQKEKEIEKQRNLMLSDMAHDIKTPITTIAGFSRALADDEVPEASRPQYLNAIYAKSMQISDLITLLFDYVKLDSAGYTLHKTQTDLCELARKCISTLYTDFEEKEMELDIDIPEEEIFVNVDPTQMERAINNILTNTIRHNEPGTNVTIQMTKDTEWVRLQFSDDGVMIPQETAVHLFEPFVQGDTTRSSRSGSGLGLSITKKIVEMHNGRIVLYQYKDAQKYGKVKMFEIRLPIN